MAIERDGSVPVDNQTKIKYIKKRKKEKIEPNPSLPRKDPVT